LIDSQSEKQFMLSRAPYNTDSANSLAPIPPGLAQRAHTFSFASKLLSADVRRDVQIVYAFARWIDDVADATELETSRKQAFIYDVVAQLSFAVPRHGDHPFVAQLKAVALRRGLDLRYARELAQALAADSDGRRIEDEEALIAYCYGVAGTVGALTAPLLGAPQDSRVMRCAIDLGIAMQMSNIARDVFEDAGMNRCYLPLDWLRSINSPHHLLAELSQQDQDNLHNAVTRLVKLARRYYERADEGIAALPSRSRGCILVASRLYQAIGEKVVLTSFARWRSTRICISLPEKIARAVWALSRPLQRPTGESSQSAERSNGAAALHRGND
jgi:15-cis-phytoene synthase